MANSCEVKNVGAGEHIPRRRGRIFWWYNVTIIGWYYLCQLTRTFWSRLAWWTDPIDIRWQSERIESVIQRNPDLRKVLCDRLNKVHLIPVSRQHSHQAEAQLRSSVNIFLNDAAVQSGFVPYNVSMANHDTHGGCRYFYNTKDLNTPYRHDEILDSSAFIFTDVDYYCDMVDWLKHWKPIMMYTLVPESVTYYGGTTSFYIKNNKVHQTVSGGASYEHEIWDYSGDTISVVNDEFELCVFSVEQRKLKNDPHRRIIWLTPTAKVPAPYWCGNFEPTGLKRKIYTYGGEITCNITYEPVADKLSIAKNGDRHSVELSGKTFEAIQKRLLNKTSPPVIADIERFLRDEKDDKYSVHAPILFELVGVQQFKPNVVRTSEQSAHFQPLGPLLTEDGKRTGAVIGNTLVENPAVFPIRSLNSDIACVKGRIQDVQNNVIPVKKYKVWANEFVKLLVPNPGKGTPWSIEDVRKVQCNVHQRGRFNAVKHLISTSAPNRLKSFIKAEPYISTNDPRNITTCDPELTTVMSTFTYAFKADCLKRLNWYGPGKTPRETAIRLGEIARETPETISTDFSRYDGTISEFIMKNITRAAYLRWVAPNRKVELSDQFNEVYRKHGVTAEGVKFEPGYGTRSGSPLTEQGNTAPNAYTQYCALRTLGYSISDSWRMIGIAFGDDGGCPNYLGKMAAALEIVARDLGLKLKSCIVAPGDPYPFLGRYFVDPAVRTCSFQDPMRTLSKLHLTANRSVTPEQALVNKAAGYASTDRLTPLIGTWAKKVATTYPQLKVKGALAEETYKCSNAWPQKDAEAITNAMAKILGIETNELKQLDQMLQESALDQIPILLTNNTADKLSSIKDDVIVGPGQQLNTQNRPIEHDDREPETVTDGNVQSKAQSSSSNPEHRRTTPGKAGGVQRKVGKHGVTKRPPKQFERPKGRKTPNPDDSGNKPRTRLQTTNNRSGNKTRGQESKTRKPKSGGEERDPRRDNDQNRDTNTLDTQ